MAESGFVEAKNGFICVSCGTSSRARRPSPEREPRAKPLEFPNWCSVKGAGSSRVAALRGCGRRSAKFLITMPFFRPQRPAVYPPAEGRHVIVTGVPRGDRIPYLYHPTLPACGQVLSAPPQPLNSTATKSSRRQSRSKRSHLLRSRSPRQSRPKSPPHRVRCTVRGPIPIRRSRPDYRSQLYGHRQSASRLWRRGTRVGRWNDTAGRWCRGCGTPCLAREARKAPLVLRSDQLSRSRHLMKIVLDYPSLLLSGRLGRQSAKRYQSPSAS